MLRNGTKVSILGSNLGTMGRNRGADQFAGLVFWHNEVMQISELLLRALAIQVDLFRRLSKRPADKLLHTEQKQYDKLICQLLWEHKMALAYYQVALRRIIKC